MKNLLTWTERRLLRLFRKLSNDAKTFILKLKCSAFIRNTSFTKNWKGRLKNWVFVSSVRILVPSGYWATYCIYGTVPSSAKAWAKFYTRLLKTQGREGSRAFPVQTFILTKQLGQSNSCLHFFLLRRVVEHMNQVLFIDTPLLTFLSMTFYSHWGKINLKKKDMKFGRPTHHLKTNKSCLGPGEISYGNNYWEDDFIKFEAGRFFLLEKLILKVGPRLHQCVLSW